MSQHTPETHVTDFASHTVGTMVERETAFAFRYVKVRNTLPSADVEGLWQLLDGRPYWRRLLYTDAQMQVIAKVNDISYRILVEGYDSYHGTN